MVLSYIFSDKPDGYSPLKTSIIFHFIFWLALLIFIFENFIIMFVQFILYHINNKIAFNIIPTSQITFLIHSIFIILAFPIQFLKLIYPFSSILYYLLKILLITIAIVVSIVNTILNYFTGTTINLKFI